MPSGRLEWFCSVCGIGDRWGDEWASWDNQENAAPLFVTCSDTCQDSRKGEALIKEAGKYKPDRHGGWTLPKKFQKQ